MRLLGRPPTAQKPPKLRRFADPIRVATASTRLTSSSRPGFVCRARAILKNARGIHSGTNYSYTSFKCPALPDLTGRQKTNSGRSKSDPQLQGCWSKRMNQRPVRRFAAVNTRKLSSVCCSCEGMPRCSTSCTTASFAPWELSE